ncbi:MAG: TIGR02172 family protein [Bacteroidales bacterium]|nr:TIGR02172 family protein [Bacteroidales bacterium]
MNHYEQINLDDYIQTGEGGQALSYTRKDGSAMAKLFLKSYGAETAEREFLISKAVYEAGIPSPKPVRLVTDGERFGGEYELIAGKRSYTRIISEEPDQLEPLTQKFAALAKDLHATPANTELFPEMSALVRPWIENSTCISEPLRKRFLEVMDHIPSPKTCLHGDLHIGNIITDGIKDYWIDLGDFSWGCPEWDFSMIYFIAYYMTPERTDQLFHLDPATLRKHWTLLVRAYYGFRTDEEVHAYEKDLLKYTALKLYFNFCKRNSGKGEPSPKLEGMANAFLSGISPMASV